MEPSRILVIEDDEIVAITIKRTLGRVGATVTIANTGAKGLEIARRSPPHLVILDVIMPEMDGFEVCQIMRSDPTLAKVPVLFLTARDKAEDRITGFEAGGDDYLCKPFNVDELGLRVEAILRRTRPGYKKQQNEPVPNQDVQSSEHMIVVGEYTLNTRTFELDTPHHGRVRLTPVQYQLLYHLMSHPTEIFTPERLLQEVWSLPDNRGSSDLVRVHVRALRARIEADKKEPRFLQTVTGFGYTVNPEVETTV